MNIRKSRLMAVGVFALWLGLLLVAGMPGSAQAAAQPVQSSTLPGPASFDCTYVVRPGDTLYRIALRYGVSPFALAVANRIANPNLVFVGMVLRVPCAGTPPAPPPPPSGVCATYIVQRGDWLARIAAHFGVSASSIAALNRLSNPNLLFVGMRLLIPCRGGSPARVIVITQPTNRQIICSPVAVKGRTNFAPFEAQLRGRVLRYDGAVLGSASIHMDVPSGQAGTFSGSIAFDASHSGSSGFVEIADLSAKDGSILAIARVPVLFAVNPSPCP